MSRSEDVPRQSPTPNENSEPSPELKHTFEVADRIGLTREAAQREMERFRDVSEYEVRKIFGQHSALHEPAVPEETPISEKRETSPADHRAERSSSPAREAEPETDDRQQKLNWE